MSPPLAPPDAAAGSPDDVADRRAAAAAGWGVAAALLLPGALLLGPPPYVPDESLRRPLAFGLLFLAAWFGPLRRGRWPTRRAATAAALALAPVVAALLRPNASALEASAAPGFLALAATILLASLVGGRLDGAILALGAAGLLASLHVGIDLATGRLAVGPFGRPGVAGPALAALLVPVGVASARWRGLPRWCRALPVLLVAGALLATRSRTGLVAAAAGALAAGLVAASPPVRRRLAVATGLLGALGALAAVLAASGVLPTGDTVRVRLGLLRASAALVAEAPLLGHGPSGFAREVLRVRDPEEALLSAGARPFAAHADLPHLAAEHGLPAACAIGALLLLAFVTVLRRARAAPEGARGIPASLVGIVAATAVASLAEDPLLAVASSLPFGLATGLACAQPGAAPARTGAPALVARLALAFLLAFAALATARIPFLGDRALASPATEGLEAASRASRDTHPTLLYRLATLARERGDATQAWRRLDRLLEVDPGATEARLDMAELHRRSGRLEDAADVLRAARRADPTRFDVVLRLGHLALGDEPLPGTSAPPADPVEILRLYDEASRLGPRRFEGAVALARLHRRLGDLSNARRELQRAKDLGGLRGETLLESFRLAEAEGADPTARIGILALAVSASPRLVFDVDDEARRLLDAGEAEEARALGAAASAQAPPDLGAADRLFAAATLRRTAILASGTVSPAEGWRLEAKEAAGQGRHRRAVATYRALLGDPFRDEDPALAFAAASSAARFDGALSDALSARGRTLQAFRALASGDLVVAERDFRAALRKVDALAAAHYGLARVLARTGASDDARRALGRAIELDPRVADRARTEPDLAPFRDLLPPPR